MELKELIARAIDPDAWRLFDENKNTVSEWRITPSLAKAEAVIATLYKANYAIISTINTAKIG